MTTTHLRYPVKVGDEWVVVTRSGSGLLDDPTFATLFNSELVAIHYAATHSGVVVPVEITLP